MFGLGKTGIDGGMIVALAAVALLLGVSGCRKGPTEGVLSVEVITPAHRSEFSPGPIPMEVEVTNFTLVDKLGAANQEDEGHLHFYLDVFPMPTTAGQPAVSDVGIYHESVSTSYEWPDVREVRVHIAGAQLVNNDHTPLDPPIFNTTNFFIID